MVRSMSKSDWMRAARLALLQGGVASVRIEKLARELGVTKGSFYWHFSDREALLEALLEEWESEADLLIGAIGAPSVVGMPALLERIAHNVVASEKGEVPSDAAIFGWAAVDPQIARRVNAAEAERVSLLAVMIGDAAKAELVYMAYLGFILRRRHSANAEEAFQHLAGLFLWAAGLTSSGPDSGAGLQRFGKSPLQEGT
jgi:AcrR family transcriptional regulator